MGEAAEAPAWGDENVAAVEDGVGDGPSALTAAGTANPNIVAWEAFCIRGFALASISVGEACADVVVAMDWGAPVSAEMATAERVSAERATAEMAPQ